LGGSSLVLGGPLESSAVALTSSTITVPAPGDVAGFVPLQIDVSGTFAIDAQSTLDLVGKGYLGGYSGGNLSASGQRGGGGFAGGSLAGGSHGGLGGHASADPAPAGEVPAAFD